MIFIRGVTRIIGRTEMKTIHFEKPFLKSFWYRNIPIVWVTTPRSASAREMKGWIKAVIRRSNEGGLYLKFCILINPARPGPRNWPVSPG